MEDHYTVIGQRMPSITIAIKVFTFFIFYGLAFIIWLITTATVGKVKEEEQVEELNIFWEKAHNPSASPTATTNIKSLKEDLIFWSSCGFFLLFDALATVISAVDRPHWHCKTFMIPFLAWFFRAIPLSVVVAIAINLGKAQDLVLAIFGIARITIDAIFAIQERMVNIQRQRIREFMSHVDVVENVQHRVLYHQHQPLFVGHILSTSHAPIYNLMVITTTEITFHNLDSNGLGYQNTGYSTLAGPAIRKINPDQTNLRRLQIWERGNDTPRPSCTVDFLCQSELKEAFDILSSTNFASVTGNTRSQPWNLYWLHIDILSIICVYWLHILSIICVGVAIFAGNPMLQLVKGKGIPITRHFFNPDSKICQAFEYNGCKGNRNNFDSQKLCQNYCLSEACPPGTVVARARESDSSRMVQCTNTGGTGRISGGCPDGYTCFSSPLLDQNVCCGASIELQSLCPANSSPFISALSLQPMQCTQNVDGSCPGNFFCWFSTTTSSVNAFYCCRSPDSIDTGFCPPQLVPVPGEGNSQYRYCSPSAPINDGIQGCGINRHCQFSTTLERYICCGLEVM